MTKKKRHDRDEGIWSGEGFLKGLTDLVEKLGELAETGERMSKTGGFTRKGKEKDVKGIYGFSVKVGLGDKGVKVEPFGNIRRDEKTGRSTVQEVREPIVDLFEEEDHLLLVAEMPGIGVDDVKIDVREDLLTLRAEKGDKKYRKEILLPGAYLKKKMTVSCNNGIVEIKCLK